MGEPRTTTKGEAQAAIRRELDAWEALLAEVGDGRMLEPGPMGEWTFKDLVAHLTVWRTRSIERLAAAARGEPEPPPPWPADLTEVDEINRWILEANAERLLAEVLWDSRESYARLTEAVQWLPEEALNDPDRFPWLEGRALGAAFTDGSFFTHLHEEHEPEIRRWLEAETTA